jgi:hypothetical protein
MQYILASHARPPVPIDPLLLPFLLPLQRPLLLVHLVLTQQITVTTIVTRLMHTHMTHSALQPLTRLRHTRTSEATHVAAIVVAVAKLIVLVTLAYGDEEATIVHRVVHVRRLPPVLLSAGEMEGGLTLLILAHDGCRGAVRQTAEEAREFGSEPQRVLHADHTMSRPVERCPASPFAAHEMTPLTVVRSLQDAIGLTAQYASDASN